MNKAIGRFFARKLGESLKARKPSYTAAVGVTLAYGGSANPDDYWAIVKAIRETRSSQ